ncbi:hypothetical protein LR032_06255 [Candidatus Bipolaricaulota bacterium]|nr:hypothetical protein [Candidatus Bipolaricaulota bacterium]
MSRSRIILALLLVGGVILWLTLPFRPVPPAPAFTRAYGVSFAGHDQYGEMVWRVEAKEGEMADDTGRFIDVMVEFFAENSDSLLARGERLTFARGTATLEGRVEIVRGEDYRLITERVVWDEEAEELTAGQVTITMEAGTIEAARFRYDLEDRRSILSGGIRAEIDRVSPLSVTGEAAEEVDGLFIVTGEVTVVGEDGTFHSGRLVYDPEEDTVRLLPDEETILVGDSFVKGTFHEGEIRAGAILLTADGFTGTGGVFLQMNELFFEPAPQTQTDTE